MKNNRNILEKLLLVSINYKENSSQVMSMRDLILKKFIKESSN